MKDVIGNMTALIAINFDQHVSGIEHTRRLDSLITPHLDNGFRGHEHFGDGILQISAGHTSLQAFTNLLLVTRIRMEYKPLLHKNNPSLLQPPSQVRKCSIRNAQIRSIKNR